MKNKVIFLVLLITSVLHASDGLALWTGTYIEGKISEKTSAAIYQEWDTRGFVHDFYYYVLISSAIFKPRKNFTFSPAFKTAFIKEDDGKWILEVAPVVSLGYTILMGKVDFYSNIKFLYRVFQFRENRGVLRAKAGFSLPVKDRIKFFIQNEFMYGYNGFKQIDENRTTVGYNAKLGKNVGVEFFYMREESKFALARPWAGTNVIGIALNTSF